LLFALAPDRFHLILKQEIVQRLFALHLRRFDTFVLDRPASNAARTSLSSSAVSVSRSNKSKSGDRPSSGSLSKQAMRGNFQFAIGGELSPISTTTFRQCIAEILLHSNYEETDLEELARDVGFRPVDQTDAGKLARQVDVPPGRDNDLVPDQKEHNADALAV
jgi:hypothetical protein